MRVPLIYHKGSLFGLDIGSRTVKVAQLERHGKGVRVLGYGTANFPPDTIIEGIIADPEVMAKAIKPLIMHPTAGKVAARKVAAALPTAKTFIRTLQLPSMTAADLDQAVRLEAEQYIPIPATDLYLDFEVIEQVTVPETKEVQLSVLMVAAPRAIVNSYIQLFDLLGLEIDSIEASLASITRAMLLGGPSDKATLVMDFGSRSADLAIYDRVVRLTGSISVGGDDLTATMSKKLGITLDQANEMKYKFGIGKSGLQTKIMESIAPQLVQITSEMKKIIKFYADRNDKKPPIGAIILSGGSASMPGLGEYLSGQLGLPITIGSPWDHVDSKHIGAPKSLEMPQYTTALGLALREVEHD